MGTDFAIAVADFYDSVDSAAPLSNHERGMIQNLLNQTPLNVQEVTRILDIFIENRGTYQGCSAQLELRKTIGPGYTDELYNQHLNALDHLLELRKEWLEILDRHSITPLQG